MMYEDLFRYLVRYKELAIPGIGTFVVEREPASIDFVAKKILAPAYSIRIESAGYVPAQAFFEWLATRLGIGVREAIFRFNEFALEFKQSLSAGNRINWNGVGELAEDKKGNIVLKRGLSAVIFESEIHAEKILREKSEHMVRVGEDQRTSAEMTAILNPEEDKKVSWWVFALAVGILALMFIGWYLSEHGIDSPSVANIVDLSPTETPAKSYRLLP